MLLIVDGSGLAHRLWFASPDETPHRFATRVTAIANGALGGHASEAQPMAVTVAWDYPAPTWRHELFNAYKSGRAPKPDALRRALSECRALPQFAHVEAPGYEADDIIGTLAQAATDDVLVLTSDKDLAQLVGPSCMMIDHCGKLTDEAGVMRRWGVPPELFRHFLSWAGDASDGLPGVRGIGPKRAIPHALAGEVGDVLTYELAGFATVPDSAMIRR